MDIVNRLRSDQDSAQKAVIRYRPRSFPPKIVQSGQVVKGLTLARKGQWDDLGSLIIFDEVRGTMDGERNLDVRTPRTRDWALGSGVSGF